MRIWAGAAALITRQVPVYAHYGLTHRCNLQCKMCGLWKMGDRATELSLVQIKQLARNLARLGVMAISIGGGEPFMRPDLPEIVKAFIDQGIEPRVLTNGLIQDHDLLKRTADSGLRHVSISLDTMDPSTQSDICHKDGIWQKIIAAVRYWAGVIGPRHGLGVLNCVVSRLNYEHLPRLVDIAEAYGFYASFVPIEMHAYNEKDLGCQESVKDMTFSSEHYAKLERVYAKLLELKQAGHNIFNSTPYLRNSLNYLLQRPIKVQCRAGALSFSISPEGHYSMCHFHSGLGTNLAPISAADPNFVNWYKAQHVAQKTRQVASTCKRCYRPCWFEVNLAFTNPTAFVQAARMRFPNPTPAILPTPERLLASLSPKDK